MTTWCIDLDGSTALLAELAATSPDPKAAPPISLPRPAPQEHLETNHAS